MTSRISETSNQWFYFRQWWRVLLISVFMLVVYNIVFGIAVTHSSETANVDASKFVTLREGIDDIGDMTLQTFVDRLSEFDAGSIRMKVTIHPQNQSNPAEGFEVRALDQSRAFSSAIHFNFLPSRLDDTYVILTTVSYKDEEFSRFRQKIQVLGQLNVLRMDVDGMRKQEEESRRSVDQFQRCMKIQRKWITKAEKALRKELRLPDNATFTQRQRAIEEERVRGHELRRRSNEVFDQCVNE